MKKSKYISKYDYIDFHTKQHSFLFHNNAEIISSIDSKIKLLTKDVYLDNDEDEDEEQEIDSLEYYREYLNKNEKMDDNNPKIIEGRILDLLSKEHIKNKYSHITNIYDFDVHKIYNQEDAFLKTKELLEQNENIIIFQPVFINDKLITRCDALVKMKNDIEIIETKGTTTVKLHHFLDLFFQHEVLTQDDFIHFNINYNLCLVDYISANKNECPFVITPYFNYSKSISKSKNYTQEQWRLAKQGYNPTMVDKINKTYEFFPINITNVLNGDFVDLEIKKENTVTPGTKKAIDNATIILDKAITTFYQDIEEISFLKSIAMNNQSGFINDIKPSFYDNGEFKKTDYWMNLRKMYQAENYELFKYSGKVVSQSGESISYYKKGDDIKPYFIDGYYDIFFSNNKPIDIDRNKYNDLIYNLKNKKVYFDFETINIATRVLDNTLPFMQIITQCSIIKDHCDGVKISDFKCNNIVIDPLNITVDSFKKIVDELYCGEDYSYIVYNKSFESTRLKEMINYINDPNYTSKINIIRNNLYDLADFFTVKKDGTPILIKEFGGFYSIKKVLPFIEKNFPELFEITGCKDYKKLNVSNGLDCQNKTTIRFFNKMSEEDWQQLYMDISTYCENDVRAMIAVELLVKKLSSIL